MKTKHVFPVPVMLLLTAFTSIAQNVTNKKPSQNVITFSKKLPPPDNLKYQFKSFQGIAKTGANAAFVRIKDLNANDIKKDPAVFRQSIMQRRNMQASLTRTKPMAAINSEITSAEQSDFHLTKDINALSESFPANYSDLYYHQSFAILDNIIYFAADDGIHGNELWRSDGTAAGTYMVKDIERGIESSYPYNITALNDKLYLSAFTSAHGQEAWISDGTENGTKILKDIIPGTLSSVAAEFVSMGGVVYFAASSDIFIWDELWQTDGTADGTKPVKKLGSIGSGGEGITQLTIVNNQLFFTFLSYDTFSWQLWRSNGTDEGTYQLVTNVVFPYVPAQLTSYANQLYFSADEGSGRKFWKSDGTDEGTSQVDNTNDVYIEADYFGINFPILDNVLYIPGYTSLNGDILYKYNTANNDGLTKVKDLTAGGNLNLIVPSQMVTVNHTLYFKVSNYNRDAHEELWSSEGEETSTQAVSRFNPGQRIDELYNSNGMLYFTNMVNSSEMNYGRL